MEGKIIMGRRYNIEKSVDAIEFIQILNTFFYIYFFPREFSARKGFLNKMTMSQELLVNIQNK